MSGSELCGHSGVAGGGTAPLHVASAPVETSAAQSRHLAQALADPCLLSVTTQHIPLSRHLWLLTMKVLTL